MDKSKSNVLSLLRKTSKGQMRYDIYDANDMTTILSGINPKPELRNFLDESILQSSSDDLSLEFLGHTTRTPTNGINHGAPFDIPPCHLNRQSAIQMESSGKSQTSAICQRISNPTLSEDNEQTSTVESDHESHDLNTEDFEETDEEFQCRIETTKYHLRRHLKQVQQEKMTKNVVAQRRMQYESHTEAIEQKMSELELQSCKNREAEAKVRLEKLNSTNKDRSTAFEEKQKQLVMHQHRHTQRLMQEAEVVEKQRQDYQRTLIEKRSLGNKIILESLVSIQAEIERTVQEIGITLNTCKNELELPTAIRQCQDINAIIVNKSAQCVEQAKANMKTQKIPDTYVKTLTELCEQVKNVQEHVVTGVDDVNKKAEKSAAQNPPAESVKESRQNPPDPSTRPSTGQPIGRSIVSTQPVNPQTSVTRSDSEVYLCAHESFYDMYQQLLEHRRTHITSFKPLEDDQSLKRYRLDLKKAVNIPINAISALSGEHLRDKLETLVELLTGKLVTIGNKRIQATQHPCALAMCKDMFASKIVNQGEVQVLSNHEAAFEIATVIVGVCAVSPDITQLLLPYFFEKCPYTIPYYPPKLPNQTSQEHYRSLGYTFNDAGEVEKQDKFLSRMSGLVRLYAAIMVTSAPPPGGHASNKTAPAAHPHGIEHAWVWLTSLVNLEPRPDITATVLYDILYVTGHALLNKYGKQFKKLQQMIMNTFLPKIKAVTPHGTSGPLTRLEEFLQKCIVTGQVTPPNGMITADFWAKTTAFNTVAW